ncbi:MAG: diguanylate cyclase [candidate division Zixibacteria bacterium]|nr:diguanylate cyclase [candidate division Zixibacteria bacterium]MBU1472121.1 diguanylate cyclase [candidate division Zixibacteria bacterium]MBU2626240.1 diguanylate cyclase [candidate division Zixibacteria bacterium]
MTEQVYYKNDILKLAESERNTRKRSFHVAVRQDGTEIARLLPDTITWVDTTIHLFDSIEQLLRLHQKYQLEIILLAASGNMDIEMDVIDSARETPALSSVPIIMYHSDATFDTYQIAFAHGAADLFTGEWDSAIFGIKLQMLYERSKRDLGVNPTSRLPGPVLIERAIEDYILEGSTFAVCYLDIDNFKAYNDYYGYLYGDKVIRLTAHIIRDIVYDLVPDGFVGHVGGDDFIFIVPYDKVEIVNSNIIKTFDSIIPYKYKKEDRERGKIVTTNRRGVEELFPLLTISIAVVVNFDQMFTHVGEMSHMLADLKNYTKKLAGSNYMIERRRKY